jgi:hypothetical protein
MMVGSHDTPPGSDAYSQHWEPAGQLRAWIGFEDAADVMIEDLGQTLCTLLCGADCARTHPRDCPSPPETIPGTRDEGYLLQAEFGAAPVTIEH